MTCLTGWLGAGTEAEPVPNIHSCLLGLDQAGAGDIQPILVICVVKSYFWVFDTEGLSAAGPRQSVFPWLCGGNPIKRSLPGAQGVPNTSFWPLVWPRGAGHPSQPQCPAPLSLVLPSVSLGSHLLAQVRGVPKPTLSTPGDFTLPPQSPNLPLRVSRRTLPMGNSCPVSPGVGKMVEVPPPRINQHKEESGTKSHSFSSFAGDVKPPLSCGSHKHPGTDQKGFLPPAHPHACCSWKDSMHLNSSGLSLQPRGFFSHWPKYPNGLGGWGSLAPITEVSAVPQQCDSHSKPLIPAQARWLGEVSPSQKSPSIRG